MCERPVHLIVNSGHSSIIHQKYLRNALRANLFTKGTDPICRLPLYTFLYKPKVSNLGDLMRFGYGYREQNNTLEVLIPLSVY